MKTRYHFPKTRWIQGVVISGKGKIDSWPIHQGDAFIIPSPKKSFWVYGKVSIIINLIN
jgi:hypothetical protein